MPAMKKESTGEELRSKTSPVIRSQNQLVHLRSRAFSLYYKQATEEGLPLISVAPPVETVRNATMSKAVYNVLCAMIGAGAIGLPGTLAGASWYGLAVILVIGAIMQVSGQCMTRCVLDDPELITFRDLGEKAFGLVGQLTVLTLQIINCVGTAILFLVLAADNAELLLADFVGPHPKSTYLWGAALASLPFCFLRNLDEIGWVSLAGLTSSLLALLCITISIVFHCLPRRPDVRYDPPTLPGLLTSAATTSFAYGGHVMFPSIIQVMRKPQEFPRALSISFNILYVVYFFFTLLCYYTFGSDIHDNVMKNLPETAFRTASLLLITAHVVFAYSLYMNPVFYLMEVELGIESPTGAAQTREQVIGRVVLRTVTCGLLLAVAIEMPFFGSVMTLIGGSVVSGSVLLLPLAIYLRLYRSRLSPQRIALLAALLAFGAFLAISSTINTAQDMVQKEHTIPVGVNATVAAPAGPA
eukprot:EG_transcript_7709